MPFTQTAFRFFSGAGLFSLGQAAIHRIITANRFAPEKIHVVEYDDQWSTLRLVNTSDAHNTHLWLTQSHDKNTLYASSLDNGRMTSYDVATLEATGHVETFGHCEGKNSAYNIMSKIEPYYIVSGSYSTEGGCGVSMSLGPDGSFQEGAMSWALEPQSSTHGLQFLDVNGTQLLFTADMGTDSIWTHSFDESGDVSEVGRMRFSESNLKPRFLQIHPNGAYIYVVLEHDNSVTALKLSDAGQVSEDTETTPFSLIPEGVDKEQHWSAVLALSPSGRYLWATSRGRGDNSGYISGFLLDGEGALLRRMFMIPSDSSGTMTSSLTAAPWSDEHVIYGDAPSGFIAVLRLVEPVHTDEGLEFSSAEVVARLDIAPGSCCSNTLWVD